MALDQPAKLGDMWHAYRSLDLYTYLQILQVYDHWSFTLLTNGCVATLHGCFGLFCAYYWCCCFVVGIRLYQDSELCASNPISHAQQHSSYHNDDQLKTHASRGQYFSIWSLGHTIKLLFSRKPRAAEPAEFLSPHQTLLLCFFQKRWELFSCVAWLSSVYCSIVLFAVGLLGI
jgi:hypothetical protein